MTRIEGAQAKWNKPLLRVVYWMTRRHIRGITERETERAIEPAEVYGHLPGLLIGYGMFVSAAERTGRVDQCLKGLATVKAATLTHCEYCIDIASSAARKAGLSDAQLLALPHYRESDRFNDLEKLVLDYAVGMTRTPVKVPDELFAALREHFDERQLVELTSAIAIENLHARFNAALDIGAAGFTDGMVCAVPDTSLGSSAPEKHAVEPGRLPSGSPVAT
jgi:AhpD family alkylhydroperoxidase